MNKVILIGGSKSLIKDKLGKIIDSFDIVCRLNTGGRPECLTGEYKDIIGSKTTIWLGKHLGLLNAYKHNTYEIVVPFPSESKLIKDCKEILYNFNKFNARPTSGILAIFYLLKKYKYITICGFDGFKGGHFYGNRFIKNQDKSDKMASQGIGAHDIFKEIEYINYLVKINKIKKL